VADTLYLFLDESGNFDFSPIGTRYLTFTGLATRDVVPAVIEVHRFKHQVIERGEDLEYFHATEDRQWVRDGMFGIIGARSHFAVYAIIIEKAKTDPSLRDMARFYPFVCGRLLADLFTDVSPASLNRIIVFMDDVPVRRVRQAVLKGIKENLKTYLAPGQPYGILMHAAKSHPYLQMVDYLGWAVYVKWARSEERPWQAVSRLFHAEEEVFRDSQVRYY
jgi:hypothetical protein